MARIAMVTSGLFLLLWFAVIVLWMTSYDGWHIWVHGSAIRADGSQLQEQFVSDAGELFFIHVHLDHPDASERRQKGWHERSGGGAADVRLLPTRHYRGWRKVGFGYFHAEPSPLLRMINSDQWWFTLIIPHWFAALLCALPPVLQVSLGRRKRVRAARLADGCCPHCGYNLAGNTSGTCPECGKTSPWKTAPPPSVASQPRKTSAVLANVALTTAAAADLLLIALIGLLITNSDLAHAIGEFMGAASMILAVVSGLVGVVAWNRNRHGRREIVALLCAALFWTIYATSSLWAPLLRRMSHQ